jgi:hypothetical protein
MSDECRMCTLLNRRRLTVSRLNHYFLVSREGNTFYLLARRHGPLSRFVRCFIEAALESYAVAGYQSHQEPGGHFAYRLEQGKD